MSDSPAQLFAGGEALPFGRRQRRARGARIPVTIVTGFLGSGKTTLIRELLARPERANTSLVINNADRADTEAVAVLTGRIRELTAAPLATAAHGVIAPAFLLDEGIDLAPRAAAAGHDHAHAHSHGINSFALFFSAPLPWPVF